MAIAPGFSWVPSRSSLLATLCARHTAGPSLVQPIFGRPSPEPLRVPANGRLSVSVEGFSSEKTVDACVSDGWHGWEGSKSSRIFGIPNVSTLSHHRITQDHLRFEFRSGGCSWIFRRVSWCVLAHVLCSEAINSTGYMSQKWSRPHLAIDHQRPQYLTNQYHHPFTLLANCIE